MKKTLGLALVGMWLLVPSSARGEFDASAYQPITQERLVSGADVNSGKKFQVTDPFQFCGSDFCVQALKAKINTRDHYCFALGSLCLVRFYIKKDHPDAALVTNLKRGDKVTVYGTFGSIGKDYNYMIVDRVTVDKAR